MDKVPDMRVERKEVRQSAARAGVSLEVHVSIENGDLVVGDGSVVRRGDIVFRADVHVAHSQERQLGHGVVIVSEAVVVALVGDELGQRLVGHTRRGVGVQDRVVILRAQVRSCERGDGGAETVAHDNDLVVAVFGLQLIQGLDDAVADDLPGGPEAQFGLAAVAQSWVGLGEGCVGDPVADRVGATESDDDGLVGVVYGHEAGSVGDGITVRVVSWRSRYWELR